MGMAVGWLGINMASKFNRLIHVHVHVSLFYKTLKKLVYGRLAHAHAHASFISTTTKLLPDSATNTNYDTLTMTAFTTTPICNLRQPGADVGLPLGITTASLC